MGAPSQVPEPKSMWKPVERPAFVDNIDMFIGTLFEPEPASKEVPFAVRALAERAALVLGDQEILTLARWACTIEEHYGRPMDMEWAKDGESGALFIVQARPETVKSQTGQVYIGFTI